jgi:hypothetical protein
MFPNSIGADFRRRYRIDLNGEAGYYLLEQVCDYTPGAPSTKCVFVKNI